MEIVKLVFIVICFLAAFLLICITLEVLNSMIIEMKIEEIKKAETEAYENAVKFQCTFRDVEHPEAPSGCAYEFPNPEDCDTCPFAKWD